MGCGSQKAVQDQAITAPQPELVKPAAEKPAQSVKAVPEPTVAKPTIPAVKEEPKPAPAPAAPKPKTQQELAWEEEAKLYGMTVEEVKQRNAEIGKRKMEAARAKGRTAEEVYHIKPEAHPHPLYLIENDNGWICNGAMLPGGCASGLTDFYQSYGMKRYSCRLDDFDFCEKCVKKYEISQ